MEVNKKRKTVFKLSWISNLREINAAKNIQTSQILKIIDIFLEKNYVGQEMRRENDFFQSIFILLLLWIFFTLSVERLKEKKAPMKKKLLKNNK